MKQEGPPPIPARLEAAFDFDRGDEALDRIARLASRLTAAPVALVSLVGERRQNFVGLSGLEDRGTPIELSICRLAVITDAPVVIEEAVSDERAPVAVVEDMGIQAYAGVPLHAGGHAVGALCAIDREARRWSPEDLAVIEDLAATAEVIIEARLAEQAQAARAARDRETSRILQRSMLPVALPEIEGVRFAAAFQPAADIVGGDFYDAFRLPDGRFVFTLGDVVGHGLAAAAAAGQIRNALRVSALEDPSPAFVVGRLNVLAHEVSLVAYSSMVYGVLDPVSGVLDWVNLGHPPALLRDGGVVVELQADHAVLGAHPPEQPLGGRRLELGPGATLLAYTDGLVERRLGDDEARIERLQELLAAQADPDTIVAGALRTIVGTAPRDDVALLCLQRTR